MTERPTYRALCRRSGGWWAVSIPELRGVHTQARRLDQVDEMARDAIALFLELDPGSFDVLVVPELPEPLRARLEGVRNQRRLAEELQKSATVATAELVTTLLEYGLTVRDVGHLFGLSHQRAAQLAHGRVCHASVGPGSQPVPAAHSSAPTITISQTGSLMS